MSREAQRRPAGDLGGVQKALRQELGHEHTPRDLMALTRPSWELWLSGYASGYAAGFDRGWAAADDYWDARGREIATFFHRMAEVPPRDAAADRSRAVQRDLYWARRRGEVA